MPTYAVYDGSQVVNVIVADTAQIAEDVTGFMVIETEGAPWVGWTLHGDEWRPPMPTEGAWEWDETTHEWVEVIPAPSPEE